MGNINDPTATVRRMFAAFRKSDLDPLIATVHPDSQQNYFGANPRLSKARFNRRAEVRKFFERILERLEIAEFNADEFVAKGETVVIFGSEYGKVRATGQRFRNEQSQKYVVKDNQITKMAEYNIQVEPRN